MTSVPFSVGLGDGSRLSSRVLRPPGGGHTDIFGGEPEPPRTGRRLAPQNAAAAANNLGPEQPKPTNGAEAPSQNGQEIQEVVPEQKPAEPVHEAKAETPKAETPKAESPITAEPLKAEPPKRVRVPPGGFSSGLW